MSCCDPPLSPPPRAGSVWREGVIRSSALQSAETARSSISAPTPDAGRDYGGARHTTVSGTRAGTTLFSLTGKTTRYSSVRLYHLKCSSLSWKKNGFCHDVSHLTDIRDCELCVSNSDFDLSPLRCCSPSNRTQCCQTFHVDLPSVLLGGGRRRCRRGQIYSKFRGGCIPLFGR